MRQAFRRYAFPMMIIAAVLAAALPLNSFALDLSSVNLTDDFVINSFGISNWNYLLNINDSQFASYALLNRSKVATFIKDPISYVTSIEFPVLCQNYYYTSSFTGIRFYRFDLPIFLNNIYSIDFDFYFSCIDLDGDVLAGTDFSSIILHTSSSSIDLSITPSSVNYKFLYYDGINQNMPAQSSINCYSISYSSTSSFDANYISFYFTVDHSITGNYFLNFCLYPNVSVSTLSSNVSSLMEGQELIVRLLDTSIAQQNNNNAVIVDRLDQILAAVESGGSGGSGSDPGTGEGEDILQEGAIKQEQLEDLGDALSNVPKPSIENITQSFDPADTLISADPGMIQNALSIVYSWDKFLILLGLFIAVGTISYIIFGKKS